MAQALFKITNAGIDALFKAEQKGLRCAITRFTIGSAYGYTPVAEDTKMRGDPLYQGQPERYKYIDQKTKLIVCQVPVEAGPFTFGEIGLWLEDGTLFALCSLGSPIEKYSSNESSVASSITLNCLLSVDSGLTHLVIGYEDNPASTGAIEIDLVDKWTSVRSPNEMSKDIFIQELLVQQLSPDGRETLLLRDVVNDRWNVGSTWAFLNEAAPNAKSTTYVQFNNGVIVNTDYVDTASGHYLIQYGNSFRVCTGSKQGTALRLTYSDALTVNGKVKVFHLDYKVMQYMGVAIANLKQDIAQNYVTLNTQQTITANKTFNGNITFTNTILGVAQYALWADLAECYESDAPYVPGTLVCFGGSKEITIATDKVNGVISTNPGFLLNRDQVNGLPVALSGRVPVRVVGRVERFDNIVLSDIEGVGIVDNTAAPDRVIAKALRSKHSKEEGLVLCATRFSLS